MALKGKAAEEWKKKNFDRSIKVPDSVVKQLLKGTKASNIAAANKPGASAQYKEAVRRFYGKNTVKSTMTPKGPTPGSPNDRENRPARVPTPNNREGRTPLPKTTAKQPTGPGGKMPKRPASGPGAKMTARDGRGTSTTKKTTTTIKVGTGSKVNKPLIDVPNMLANSQAKLDKKNAATQALLEKNKKIRMDNAKKNKK